MINWKIKSILLLLLTIVQSGTLLGQVKMSRQVVDSVSNVPIKDADISIRGKSINIVLTTDATGRFEVSTVDSVIILLVSADGYNIYTKPIYPYKDTSKVLQLTKKLINLREVTVSANFGGIRIRKDTTEFTADSIPQRYSADVMEMLSYIPGLKIENGTMFYNGEQIEYIQIEGNEYTATTIIPFLKSILAKNIDKIQIINRAREQINAGLTPGNGTRESILNITLKTNAKRNVLGTGMIGAGSGTSKVANIIINRFWDKDQLLVASKYDNINNAVESGSLGNGGRIKQGDFTGSYSRKINDYNRFNFNVHYSQNSTSISRQVISTQVLDTGQLISNSVDSSSTTQHKLSVNLVSENRFSKSIRTVTALFLDRSNLDVYSNNQFRYLKSNIEFSNGTNIFQDKPSTDLFRVINNMVFTLPKKYGTLLTAIGYTITQNLQNSYYASDIITRSGDSVTPGVITIYRKNPIVQKGRDLGWTIQYDVNLGSTWSLKYLGVTYVKKNDNAFTTFDRVNSGEDLWKQNDSLSAKVFSRNITSNNYLTVSVTGIKAELTTGFNLFYGHLNAHTANDTASNSAVKLLPTFSFNFKPNKETAFKLDMNWAINFVSPSQLLSVTNYSNPLLVTSSNKDLRNEEGLTTSASYTHLFRRSLSNLLFRFDMYNGKNKITTDISYDSLGRQYSKPINLGNFNTYNFRVDYSTFLFNKKVNVNLGSNAAYSQTPFKLNGVETNVEATTLSGNLGLTYLPSKALRIIGNIGGNYTKNIYTGMDNDQYAKSISIGGGFQFESKTGFTANAMYTQTINFGLPIGLSQSPELLNMGVGKKIIKGKAEINLRVYDLLNKFNTNTRTTGIGFIQDSHTNSLQRFVLGSFTWYFGN